MRSFVLRAVLLVVALACSPLPAELLSKTYQFKGDVTLEIAQTMQNGLRVDSVRFEMPAPSGGRVSRTSGLSRARVAVSNTSGNSLRFGLAIALFDADARLVGVASGGTHLMPLRAGRQNSFAVVFDDVNAEALNATSFQISIETKP